MDKLPADPGDDYFVQKWAQDNMPGTETAQGTQRKLGTGLGARPKLKDGKLEWVLDQFSNNDD